MDPQPNSPQPKTIISVAQAVQKALDSFDGDSRFDKLIALRDECNRVVNLERDAEKKRLYEERDKLREQIKVQSNRLRSVSLVTKPRGKRPAKVATEGKAAG